MANFQLRALRKAARILGGENRLCALLDAPPGAFSRWMQDLEPVPTPVFMMVLDFLSDMEAGAQLFGSPMPTLPARES